MDAHYTTRPITDDRIDSTGLFGWLVVACLFGVIAWIAVLAYAAQARWTRAGQLLAVSVAAAIIDVVAFSYLLG